MHTKPFSFLFSGVDDLHIRPYWRARIGLSDWACPTVVTGITGSSQTISEYNVGERTPFPVMSVHRFELLFKIEPAGDFGLPVQDTVVVKAVEGKAIYSATFDGTTGNFVSHGALPVYRDDSEAVHVERDSDGLQIRIHDNFLTVQAEGEDYVSVQDCVLSVVDRFVQLLSLTKNTYFQAEFVQAVLLTGNERSVVRIPRRTELMKVQMYNLDSFKEGLSWSLDSIPFTMDRRLAKALDYLNHGLFLSNVRAGIGFGNATAQSYLAADIFSNFYKAASVIVGDPSKDSDFQSRYKKIGLSREFWKGKIEHIRKLRNDYGIAHYDLDGKQLQGEVETAAQVAKTVIDYYIKSLRQKRISTGKS